MNPRALLIALKGMPLTVLIALWLVRRPMLNLDLQEFLASNDRTVARACAVLEANELAQKGAQGWVLTIAGEQMDFFENIAGIVKGTNPPLINSVVESLDSESRDSTLTTNRRRSRRKYDSSETVKVTIEPFKPQEEIDACLQALTEGGIHGKKAEEIAQDPKITVDDITAHLAAIRGETWGSPLGMVIYRLQAHIHPPEIDPDTGHAVGCECNGCRAGHYYSGGAFAEHLNRGSVAAETGSAA